MNDSQSSFSDSSFHDARRRREAIESLPESEIISKASSLSAGKDWRAAVELLAPRITILKQNESQQIMNSVNDLVLGLSKQSHKQDPDDDLAYEEIRGHPKTRLRVISAQAKWTKAA
jgi:hypothetical protein